MLVDGVGQRVRHARGVALRDVTDALVDRDLKLDERFLGADLVVECHDFEIVAVQHATLAVDQRFGCEFELVKAICPGSGKWSAQRINKGNLDILGKQGAGAYGKGQHGPEAEPDGFAHCVPP